MAEIDITELAQRMKAAAEKTKHAGEVPVMQFDTRIATFNEYQITVCPDNVLALVGALEKGHRYIEELRAWNAGLAQESFERQQHIAMIQNFSSDKASHHAGCAHGNGENCASGNEVQDNHKTAGESNYCRSNQNLQVVQVQSGIIHAPGPVRNVVHVDEKSRCTIQTAPALDSSQNNTESRCGNYSVNDVTAGKTLTITLPPLPVLGSKDEWYQGFAAGAGSMREDCASALTAAGLKVV